MSSALQKTQPGSNDPILTFGASTVFIGRNGGKFPYGNSVLVQGSEEAVIIDPSKSLKSHVDQLPKIDRILLSHCHQDHVAGVHQFPEASCHAHEKEVYAIQSMDGICELHGVPADERAEFESDVVKHFSFTPRLDTVGYKDGDIFDLGGGVTIEVIYTPGHTHGHSCLLVRGEHRKDDLLFLADIELSGFGPYYGGVNSSLEQFDQSLDLVRSIDVPWFCTFHHLGVLDKEAFLKRSAQYQGMIGYREKKLLDYMATPRTIDQAVQHRIIYRKSDVGASNDRSEHWMLTQHVARMLKSEQLKEVEPGFYQAC
ncbi:MAG: MBL fold metallo-hydrolase [Pseudomonadales bacterium]|nr:MBL fold metallo-hydrolase [Pseudomonadales bacterium]